MTASLFKTCPNGHTFQKSSACPTCPKCEAARKPKDHFLSTLSAPARRALERENITTLEQLTSWSEKELAKLHGIGPSSFPKLRKLMDEIGLKFKSE